MLSHFWTTVHQAPLFTRFSQQEYWRGLLCPPPGHLLDPGIKPISLVFPALAGGFFATEPPISKAPWKFYEILNKYPRKFEFLSPQVSRYLLNIILFEIRAVLKAVSFYSNSL